MSIPTNVGGESKLWGQYVFKGEYELLRDVFLIRPDNDIYIYKDPQRKVIEKSSERLALTPENSYCQNAGLYSAPNTIKEYELDPEESVKKDYKSFISVIDVVGIVRKGTKIRCIRLDKDYQLSLWFGAGTYLSYYAQIMDGPYLGSEVDIQDLSISYWLKGIDSELVSRPDPKLLKLIQK